MENTLFSLSKLGHVHAYSLEAIFFIQKFLECTLTSVEMMILHWFSEVADNLMACVFYASTSLLLSTHHFHQLVVLQLHCSSFSRDCDKHQRESNIRTWEVSVRSCLALCCWVVVRARCLLKDAAEQSHSLPSSQEAERMKHMCASFLLLLFCSIQPPFPRRMLPFTSRDHLSPKVLSHKQCVSGNTLADASKRVLY